MEEKRSDYLHGYSSGEQQRLVDQSLYLEPWIYPTIDFSTAVRVVEVGCGVGAQLAILARRFPHLHLTGIDRSEAQLAKARILLARELGAGRVALALADGAEPPFPAASFDGAFLCWVLEHAADHQGLLGGLRQILAEDAIVYATEVFNASLFIHPPSPAIMKFWARLNAHQLELAGDPFVGVKLGNLLVNAGFVDVEVAPVVFHLDRRWRDDKARGAFFAYWQALLHSAAPGLEAAGRLGVGNLKEVDAEFAAMGADPEAIFYVSAFQAKARNGANKAGG